MMPATVYRCPGEWYEAVIGGRMALPQCVECVRRLEGIRDYMAGAKVSWMEPPKETPCPERMEAKK